MEVRRGVAPAITTPDRLKLIGQDVERIDTTLKSTGASCFAIDTYLRPSRPGRRRRRRCGELGLTISLNESP
jgi:hypothetical protein